jgi:hypothetical protein
MEHIRPEDLRLIADLFKRWIPPNHDKRSIDQIKEDQAALLPMLRVSKVSRARLMKADFSISTTTAPLLYTRTA